MISTGIAPRNRRSGRPSPLSRADRVEQAVDELDQAAAPSPRCARGVSAPAISRRTRVCSGGSLKTRLVVWCSNSGEAPYFGPNSSFLSELNDVRVAVDGEDVA